CGRRALEADEPAVEPAVELGLLLEALHHSLAVQAGHAELELGLDDGHGAERAVGRVEPEQRVEVDVGAAVGVGGAEAACFYALSHARDATAGGGLLPRVDAVDG